MARRHKDDAPQALTEEDMKIKLDAILAAEKDKDKAHEEFKSANGIYRNTIKDAKKAGMDNDAINLAIQLRKRDAEETRLKYRNTGIYLRLMNVSIGTQFGLFDQPFRNSDSQEEANVSTPADGTSEENKATAYHQGETAGRAGKNLSTNPYNKDVQFILHEAWSEGWNDAQSEMTRQMAATAGKSGDKAKPKRGGRRKAATAADGPAKSGNGGDTADPPTPFLDANHAGMRAGFDGEPRHANPYDPDKQAQEHDYWNRGWVGGEKQRKASLPHGEGHA